MTPMKAIRLKCLDCCWGSSVEVKLCTATDCPLWVYRSGHNPARVGVGRTGINKPEAYSTATSDARKEDPDDEEQ